MFGSCAPRTILCIIILEQNKDTPRSTARDLRVCDSKKLKYQINDILLTE
jgi:hypothetical protein